MQSFGEEGQKVHGTFREQFAQLEFALDTAVANGAATPEEYRGTLLQVLKSIEALRIKNETALMRLKEQEGQYVAMVRSCSMLGSLVLNIVEARTREHTKIKEGSLAIEKRYIEELKGQVEELKAAGKESEAKELLQNIEEREAALERQEQEGASQAALKTFVAGEKELKKATATPPPIFESPPNPQGSVQPSRNPLPDTMSVSSSLPGINLTEIVQDSLTQIPVNEASVLGKDPLHQTAKRKRPSTTRKL